ncbi:hypothetical protein TcG_00037 [Trypanosoma cruzi]|uniref:Uncharacterized protein n=1 Tax=Trypanosoma cruzi TaxID=5693 RepID=A0A2V2VHU2_TRYCR|nr:hypothetical protein C4B63_20g194 [Trypanosoma cruzi]RNF25422.1 hypothetical protein TcG_00037 [Trypanosoma cruzi]
MSLKKSLEELTRRSSLRRSSGLRTSQVIIVGKRMVEDGCDSIVSLASSRLEERRQRRVVLHGVGTGDVIRAPSRFFDQIVEERRLPKSTHCYLWRGRGGCGPAWVRPRAIPCVHHAEARSCTRCPWMGLATAASREIKSERLRRTIESSLLPLASSSPAGGGQPELTRSPPSVRFFEPFEVPVAAHSMREMEFYFRRLSSEESLSSGQGMGSPAVTGEFCFSPNLKGAPECFLSTLEQQRLLLFLNRWAERLPPPVQQCLSAVFILQHSREGVTRLWERDLHVTLLLRQDVSNFGEQGPLCSPSQPEGLLSLAEQQLVDTVLSAVHLTKRLGIATVCSDGSMACLYPRPQRVECTMTADVAELVGVVPCVAVHGPSGKKAAANLPFMHSTVAFILGARDVARLEVSPPSLWRHAMSLEAVGSVLLSILGDFLRGGVLLLLPDPGGSLSFEEASTLSQSSGAHLLATAVSQWLGSMSTMSVVYIAREDRENGRGKWNLKGFDAAFSSTEEGPAMLFCLLDSETDVEATVHVLRHGMTSLEQDRLLLVLKRIVFLQLTADGDFYLLANALCSVTAFMERRFKLGVDCGIVDIDPWTAATVGYVVLEISPFTTS